MPEERTVFGSVTDQDTAQNARASSVEQELFVDPAKRVVIGKRPAPAASAPISPKLATSTPISLSLVEDVETGECALRAGEVRGDDVGHLITRGHEAMDHAAVQRDLADCKDVRVAGPQRIIDNDPPARADAQPAGAGQFVARADSCRDHDHVQLQPIAVGKLEAFHLAVAEELLRALIRRGP